MELSRCKFGGGPGLWLLLSHFTPWLSGEQVVELACCGFVITLWVSEPMDVGYRPHQLYTHLLVRHLALSGKCAVQAKRVFRDEIRV